MARAARYFTEVMDDRTEDLQAMLEILRDVGAKYALIGGLAVGYHGHERATVDVDMLVPGRFLQRLTDAVSDRGYEVEVFLDNMIRVYPPDSDKSIADFVSADANPVLRAAFKEVESAEVLGERVSIVTRAALVALKFHAAVSPEREIQDKYQDIADIGHILKAGFPRRDEDDAHRIAALSYPGAGDDFETFMDDLRHGRPVRF